MIPRSHSKHRGGTIVKSPTNFHHRPPTDKPFSAKDSYLFGLVSRLARDKQAQNLYSEKLMHSFGPIVAPGHK